MLSPKGNVKHQLINSLLKLNRDVSRQYLTYCTSRN